MGRIRENFLSGAEILIAEDSQTQAAQLNYYLKARGFAVTVATNGKQALAAALHLAWRGLVGLTSCGRATIDVLNINEPERIDLRALLVVAGLFPPD